ncbi:MAG: prepilin-type N-terminal cleavage/methylation domain-containing protein [Gammaproteobacteria bacterium]|nr:prepilin-type N-terminal cleavage/methylation domain-containing protein [Gammaproteobacteria bacterium]
MNSRKTQQGFTLMELMIVVGIMAILAMAAIPVYQGYLATTRGNTHFQNYDEARRFIAGECAKVAAGGTATPIVTTLNNNGEKQAPGNEDQPAFIIGARADALPGQVAIDGLNGGVVDPGNDVTVSLGTQPARGASVTQYPGHQDPDMPQDSTIICASS